MVSVMKRCGVNRKEEKQKENMAKLQILFVWDSLLSISSISFAAKVLESYSILAFHRSLRKMYPNFAFFAFPSKIYDKPSQVSVGINQNRIDTIDR